MDKLAPLWHGLLRQQRHTIFQRFSWNRLAAEIFLDRMTPHVISVETPEGAAILPAAINHSTQRVEWLGETLFDYRDVLHAGDPEALRQAWLRVAACGLPLDLVAIEGHAAHRRWKSFPLASFSGAPRIDREGMDEQQFRAAHLRLGHRLRRLRQQGVHFDLHTGRHSALVREIYQRKSTQLDSGNVFHDERRRDFMVAAAALEADQCELFVLESHEGSLIAALVTFRDGDVRRFYTTYFDPAWAKYSPGMLLLYEATARTLAEGLSCDYMTGEQTFKLRLATSREPLYRLPIASQELSGIVNAKRSLIAA